MVLVFHGTGADCHVGEQVSQIPPVFRIEHLVRRGQAGLFDVSDMQFPNGDQAFQQIRRGLRIGLMHHAFIALSGRTRLVGIDSGDDDTFVPDLLLKRNQTVQIIHNGRFVVCRTGTDNDQKTVIGPRDHVSDLPVSLFFLKPAVGRKRIIRLDLFWNR